MRARSRQESTLFQKLRRLPPERIAEVEDFVDFLRQREEERELVRSGAALTGKVLMRIWDNDEDAAYDSL